MSANHENDSTTRQIIESFNSEQDTKMTRARYSVLFITWIAGACSWTIVDLGVARRLWIYAVSDAVVAFLFVLFGSA